jgi:hypothetical protein
MLFCELGFWGWISVFVGFLSFSFPSHGTLNRPAAVTWGLVFIIFYSLWIVGMLQA